MERKNKAKYSTLQNMMYVCKGAWEYEKRVYLYFGIFTVLTSVSPFIGIFFPKFILEELMGEKRQQKLIILLVAFFIISSIVGYLTVYLRQIYYPCMMKIRFEYINDHSKRCMTTDFKNTEDSTFLNDMETAFRGINNNDSGIEGMLHSSFKIVGSLIAFVGYIAIVLSLNIFLLIYLVINVMISYFLTFKVKKFEHSKKDDISDNDRRVNYLYNIMYDFSYGKEMRIYKISDWVANLFKKYKEDRLEIHKQIKFKNLYVGIVDVLLFIIREGIIYGYLIYLVITNKLSIPNFTMYFAAIASFSDWFNNIIKDIATMRGQSLDICDLRKFIEKVDEMETKNTMNMPSGPYEFEFRNVSFKYPGSDHYIYKNLNLKIPKGQKLAIVGHNGAGKTTFIKLLGRLYDVTDGEILLGGINIKCFSKSEYYQRFSAVFQEVKVLAFSIAENITLSEKDNIDYKKLNNCIENAGLLGKVNTLKNGVNTSIQKIIDDEGIEFSGGENQKIAMARALYKDGDIMILDEPTAALDALAEYNTYINFNKMVKNKTAIYISHRLASTHFCDNIAMFEKGELVEYGTHDELLALKGKYADMFETQAKYYKESERAVV